MKMTKRLIHYTLHIIVNFVCKTHSFVYQTSFIYFALFIIAIIRYFRILSA